MRSKPAKNNSANKDKPESEGKKGRAALDDPKAPPTPKQLLFGSWTGKTPVNLVYDICQREAWQKPQFYIVPGI